MRRGFALLLALALAGCPDGTTAPKPPGGPGTAPATTGGIVRKPRERTPAATTDAKAKDDYREDPDFSRAAIATVYRAEQLATEAELRAVLREHGLADAAGKKDAARAAKLERALQRFATERPDEWSALVFEVEKARAKGRAVAGVEKK